MVSPDALREEAGRLDAEGRPREAIEKYSKYLEMVPHDIDVLNNYGVALSTVGRRPEGIEILQRAIALDDAYLPSLINLAGMLRESGNSEEALVHIKAARIQAPGIAGVDGCYSSILFARGDAEGASRHALRNWLNSFNSLRSANQFLFTATYAAVDESKLTAEHRFWAETLAPPPQELAEFSRLPDRPRDPRRRRLRIGYWAPDFREHSLRYFFRPLLEGHDSAATETFVFHDSYFKDAQTELVKLAATHFFDVSEYSDRQLVQTIVDCDLDVLVELSGHTSTNRLHLLRFRLARLQMTGLGYPSTVGLKGIDVKLSDIHIEHQGAAKYYAENLGVLPQSFWCFDPLEEIPCSNTVSSDVTGHITYGCFGNIAKINSDTLAAWAKILVLVPDSRLQIKAINFEDPEAKIAFVRRLEDAGMDMTRVDIRLPQRARDLFASYEQIDVVLDTYPFNGGTTSCFATYMGIPIVTLSGQATASRMGKSVVGNLACADLAVETWQDYVDRAVKIAGDAPRRRAFKTSARGLYQSSALGNGAIFARHFVDMCASWLERDLGQSPANAAFALPAAELARRARVLFRSGNFDAAHRIVDYCLREYPRFVDAHILRTERLARQKGFGAASNYLEGIAATLSPSEASKLRIQQARYTFLEGDRALAVDLIGRINPNDVPSDSGIALRLLQLACDPAIKVCPSEGSDCLSNRRFTFLVPTDHLGGFDEIKAELMALAAVEVVEIAVVQCGTKDKVQRYRSMFNDPAVDILVLLQPTVSILEPVFFRRIIFALAHYDIVSFLGADKWANMDWRDHAGQNKFGSVIVPSGELKDGFELQIVGNPRPEGHQPAGVLDGTLLALDVGACRPAMRDDFFVSDLEEAETLAEDFLAYALGRGGAVLGVHSALPISVDWRIPLPQNYLGPARQVIYDRLEFDPLAFEEYEPNLTPAPTTTSVEACRIQTAFFAYQQ